MLDSIQDDSMEEDDRVVKFEMINVPLVVVDLPMFLGRERIMDPGISESEKQKESKIHPNPWSSKEPRGRGRMLGKDNNDCFEKT